MEVRQLSRFHPIGQGLFYSASFYHVQRKREIRYVIDCGTVTDQLKLRNEIIDYVNTFSPYGQLDMLIISHLHYDHVSGIPELLTQLKLRGISIGKIFLPYLDSQLRVLLFASWRSQMQNDVVENIESWYNSFLLDPAGYLLEEYRGTIEDIIFVDPGEEPEGELSKNKFDIFEEDIERDIFVRGKDLPPSPVYNGQVKFKSSCSVSLYGLIEFDFWSRPIPRKLRRVFNHMVSIYSQLAGSMENLLQQLSNNITGHPL